MASQFQKEIENDIKRVFLNCEEFGEKIEICGHRDVPASVQSLELELPPQTSDERKGVSYEGVAVFVSASDVPEELFAGKAISFKDEEWFVLSATCEMGLKKIELYRERA